MKKITLIVMFSLIFIGACRKKGFDTPIQENVAEGPKLSIQTLKERCIGDNSLYHFGVGDTNLYVTVIMDELSGNIYKSVYVRDDDGGAICLKLMESGGLAVGDRIRVNLNFSWLVCANKMVSLDSVDLVKSIVKLSSGNAVTTKKTSIDKLLQSIDYKSTSNFQSQLIELEDAEFVITARGKPFANAIGKTALEYQLANCARYQIAVRTSGMANFASKLIPSGNGKFVAIVQQYNEELTLIIRNFNEIQFLSNSCSNEVIDTVTHKTYLSKNFDNGNLLSGGWLTVNASGTSSWTTSNLGQPNYYARIYNKNNNIYEACESWLISPEIDLSTCTDPIFGFMSAYSSTVSTLKPYLLENYVSGVPTSTMATESSYIIPKSSFSFIYSSDYSVANYKNKKFRVAFKYTGTATSGSIWEIDDVIVRERN